jgi:hypothetical protein
MRALAPYHAIRSAPQLVLETGPENITTSKGADDLDSDALRGSATLSHGRRYRQCRGVRLSVGARISSIVAETPDQYQREIRRVRKNGSTQLRIVDFVEDHSATFRRAHQI